MQELALFLIESKLPRDAFVKLMWYIQTNFDMFPSIKQVWDFATGQGFVGKKDNQDDFPIVECFFCNGIGYVICQDLEGRKGPAHCTCEVGYWIKKKSPFLHSIKTVEKCGGIVGVKL